MGISEWVAVAVGALALAMTGLGKRTVRFIGSAVLVLSIVGGVYAHFHPTAEHPTHPAVRLSGNGITLDNITVSGGRDAILINSGHNTLNHVEAIGTRNGINVQGPGYNTFNDVKAIGGTITPAAQH